MNARAAHLLVEEKGKEWAEKYPCLDVAIIVNLITDGVMIGLQIAVAEQQASNAVCEEYQPIHQKGG